MSDNFESLAGFVPAKAPAVARMFAIIFAWRLCWSCRFESVWACRILLTNGPRSASVKAALPLGGAVGGLVLGDAAAVAGGVGCDTDGRAPPLAGIFLLSTKLESCPQSSSSTADVINLQCSCIQVLVRGCKGRGSQSEDKQL